MSGAYYGFHMFAVYSPSALRTLSAQSKTGFGSVFLDGREGLAG
jgi:hypothetical protein